MSRRPDRLFGLPLRTFAAVIAMSLAVAGCSQDPPSVTPPPTTATPTTTSTTVPPTTTTVAPTTTEGPGTAVVTTVAIEIDDADAPVVRPEENEGPDQGQHWIGRNTMTDDQIEVVWSAVEGASAYRVFRTEITSNLDRENIELTDDLLVYDGLDQTFTDTDVVTGTFYSYLLLVEVDGTQLGRRWANALAVTDTEPPAPITGLGAEVTADGILLRWDQSPDNVEFASYSVSLVVDGELRYLGGGADLSQTSFLDDRPEPGTNTYAVQAVDFHNNRTEVATIEVVAP